MTIKNCFSAAAALLLAVSLSCTPASAQDAPGQDPAQAKAQAKPAEAAPAAAADTSKPRRVAVRRVPRVDPVDGKLISPYTLAERTAMSRADCKPNALRKDGVGMHGLYRGYADWDPQLKSIEGRKQFDACVKRGLEPTPWFAFGQRGVIAMGGKFFGRGKEECLMCHSKY